MTAMTEPTVNGVLHGALEPVESVSAAPQDETSLVEAFENTLEISQDDQLTQCAASEETDCRHKLGQEDQQDGQRDGPTVCPPAAETSSAESKWAVGAQCRAVWSEDGQVYPATVVSLDGESCRVRFDNYGNEEDVELSALKRPNPQPAQRQSSQDWGPGSRCRAVYSEDGLVYPAVVLWVKGQRCRVRFDDYNNEEEQDVSGLLNPDELLGPSRAAKVKERDQSKVEREAEEKKREEAEKPTNHSFFPPFPPPPSQLVSGDPRSFVPPPPPPPLWTFGGKESGGSAGVDATSSMLMLWYMCGFHTGSFMAQQLLRPTSKD